MRIVRIVHDERDRPRRVIHAWPLPVPVSRRAHETSFRFAHGISKTEELADWQSRDKTPTIYDRSDFAAAIYEIECPPIGRRHTVRLSIDLISRKGESSDFYAAFLNLTLREFVSFQSYTFPSEQVCARFMSKFLLTSSNLFREYRGIFYLI